MIRTRRLLREAKECSGEQDGVYIHFHSLDTASVMVTGPEHGVYKGNLFLFEVEFPAEYPTSPPRVAYVNGGAKVHPNIYACGKVCLSLLNTWSENEWLPSYTTRSVFVQIRSLLGEYPLRCEPGFSSATEHDCKRYNDVVRYKALFACVLNVREKLDSAKFEQFIKPFTQHAGRVREYLMDYVSSLCDQELTAPLAERVRVKSALAKSEFASKCPLLFCETK